MILDLLFLAIIVIFIFYRLFRVLGKRPNFENPTSAWDNIFSAHFKNKSPQKEKKDKPSSPIQDAQFEVTENGVKGGQPTIDRFKQMDSTFTVGSFLEGAQSAFDLVLQGYAEGKLSEISSFVAPEVIKSFSSEIDKRGTKTYTLDIHELSSEIMDAQLTRSSIIIDIRFLSEQKWSERDDSNPSYRHDEVLSCTDRWSFERQLKNKDPNWTLIATNEESDHKPTA